LGSSEKKLTSREAEMCRNTIEHFYSFAFLARASEKGFPKVGKGAQLGANIQSSIGQHNPNRPNLSDLYRESITQLRRAQRTSWVAGRSRNGILRSTQLTPVTPKNF
jgi:hypothetical protein